MVKNDLDKGSKICWANVLSLLTMPLEGIFFFGIIMGWPNLAEIYKDLGVYEDVCDLASNETIVVNGTINCPARDVIFTTAGTVGSVTMNMAVLPLGYIFDTYGTFWCRALCTIFMSIGLGFLAFAQEVEWFVYLGIIFYSSGGFSLLVTNHALSVLFPVIAGFIIVFGQSVFQVSGSTFRIWSWMYSSGIDFRWIVCCNLAMTILLWIRTCFLMPVGWTKRDGNVYHLSPFYNKFNVKVRREKLPSDDKNVQTFKSAAGSTGFILMILWICIGNLNCLFTTFTWGQYARYVDEEGYKEFVDYFGTYLWTAAVFSTFAGINIDFLSAKLVKRGYPLDRGKVVGTLLFVLLDNIVGLIMGGLQLVSTSESTFGLVFVFNLYRAWCYSTTAVYVKSNFPIEYFGRLMGIMRVSMGISSLFVLALSQVPKAYPEIGFIWVFWIFMAAQIVGFIYPVHGLI